MKQFNAELQMAADAVDWENVQLEVLCDLVQKRRPEESRTDSGAPIRAGGLRKPSPPLKGAIKISASSSSDFDV